ncbi:MAG: LytTR family DNA-binding domain-containing protein [Parvularculaceae bacterium]
MTLRAAYFEDEPHAAQAMETYINAHPLLSLCGGASSEAAAKALLEREEPDVLFADIKLSPGSGVAALRAATHAPSFVIFTTAFDVHAVEAFELGAVDYLLKPFGRKRFEKAVDRIAARAAGAAHDASVVDRLSELLRDAPEKLRRLHVRVGLEIRTVPVADVVRFEAESGYVRIFIGDREYDLTVSLFELEKRLDPDEFVRISRSCIANRRHIVVMRRRADRRLAVEFSDGASRIASRERSKGLRKLCV